MGLLLILLWLAFILQHFGEATVLWQRQSFSEAAITFLVSALDNRLIIRITEILEQRTRTFLSICTTAFTALISPCFLSWVSWWQG